MTNVTLNVITEFCIVDIFLSGNNSQLEQCIQQPHELQHWTSMGSCLYGNTSLKHYQNA